MTPQEELFAKFYNKGKLLVAEMDDIQLREHRQQLSEIALEAKATLMATDDEIRERDAKKGKNKEWLTSVNTNARETDAINQPKIRAARMSKMDKLKEQLEKAGLDDDTIKEMMKNLQAKATDKAVSTLTFTRPATETVAIQVKKSEEISEPFDPSKLNFGN